MQALDAVEQLVSESQKSAGVLGRGQDFILFRLDVGGVPLDHAALAEATSRGMTYCGVFGLQEGQVKVLIEAANPGAALTMCFAGLAFARLVADELTPTAKPQGDGVDWLRLLAELPDTRTAT